VVGLSVHGYLVVRAKQNPVINETAPSTWKALWEEFTREQYKPPSPLERSGNWTYQLDHMFWRYFRDEFTMGPPMQSKPGVAPWTGLLAFLAMGIPLILGEFGRLYQLLKGRPGADRWLVGHLVVWLVAVTLYTQRAQPFFQSFHGDFMDQSFDPGALAIGLVFVMCVFDLVKGIQWQRQLFVLFQGAFLVGSLALILYLNFKDPQVRERDYFFLWGYEAFTLWIGIGVVALIREMLALSKVEGLRRVLIPVLGLVGLCLPVATCAHFYFEQDRTGNYVARDYAYNMLVPLAPNAMIFTNGDNDTFPLWYLQEVEGIRRDVRVVNLSLLNTQWYIKQMRDLEPKVPISFRDDEIDRLEPYRAADGSVVLVKDILVHHIIDANRYRKPVYLAVTVPEQMGLERQLSLEGLAFRILADTTHGLVNLEATRKAVYETFLYRGLLDSSGVLTQVPYKDDNAVRLAGNYASAHMRLAYEYRDRGDFGTALKELDRAERISPDYVGIPVSRAMLHEDRRDTTAAIRALEQALPRFRNSPELNYRLGIMYALRGRYQDGYQRLDVARQNDPENTSVVLSEFSLLVQMGKLDLAESVIRPYLDSHPEDVRSQQIYEQLMTHYGKRAPAAARMPMPSMLPGVESP
jgi:Tfp pilus assembly protein PilF